MPEALFLNFVCHKPLRLRRYPSKAGSLIDSDMLIFLIEQFGGTDENRPRLRTHQTTDYS